jgi:5-methylthioadenosine/S-adenosylhomocysteine deaminase
MTDPRQDLPPETADIVIRGCDAVTLDDAGTVLRDATIAISAGRITWIGESSDATPRAETVLDGRGRIALPGMIDAHVHTAQQLLRGKLSEISRTRPLRMPPWKNYYIPFESLLEPEDVHLSGLVTYTNMIMSGTTCFAESGGPHPDEMARAALEVGIRGFVALSTVDKNTSFAGPTVPGTMMMTTDQALERNVSLVKRWRREGQGRVQGSLALRQIIVCTPELTKAMSAAAHELDCKIHTHLAEGTYEVDYALEHFNRRPTEYLDELGVLSRHLHGAHSVILTPEEVDLYQEHRVSACHCSMGNYGIGIPRLHEMWRRGIDIGLGTDGAASAGTLDIFQIAHAARVGQAAVIGHPYHIRTPMSAEELLKVATRGGARAMGLGDEVGSLEVGKRADLLLVDATDPDQMGAMDPLFIAATCIVGRDVRSVVVDGKLVMKEREMLTIDLDALRHRLAKRRPEIMARFDAMVA